VFLPFQKSSPSTLPWLFPVDIMLADYLTSFETPLINAISNPQILITVVAIVTPLVIALKFFSRPSPSSDDEEGDESKAAQQNPKPKSPSSGTTTIMSPPKQDLAPPKSDPFTLDELKRYDGRRPDLPIYVSIKGTVFDVTHKRDVYGPPNGSYRVFAGKDASKAFGLSSLKEEDADPDWSTLGEKEGKTLGEWFNFFRKRYNVVGRVVDMPPAVQRHVWIPAVPQPPPSKEEVEKEKGTI